jgi:enoyl-CoA hydratase
MNTVLIEDSQKTRIITINRPANRNAIDKQTAIDLQNAFIEFEKSDQRVAIITGSGDGAFSAGADIKDPPEIWRNMPSVGFDTTKPIIAAISGWCIGGALMTVAMCDLAVATQTARFSYPEGKIGVTGGVAAALVGRIPHKLAMELVLLGRVVSAQRAYEMGLINEVVPDGAHMETALQMAREMEEMAPLVLQGLKRFVRQVLPRSPSEDMLLAQRTVMQIAQSDDHREGALAFKEKRAPVFTGR